MTPINSICVIETFAAGGVGEQFRLGGSNLAVQGRLVKAGAVGATVTMHATNTPDDATSWLLVGALVLAGNDDVNDKVSLSSALAFGRLTVSGFTAGAVLKVSVSTATSAGGGGVTHTDKSGTVTAGGTAQVLAAANTARRGYYVQNLSAGDLWLSSVGVAAATQPSMRLPPGALYESPQGGCPVSALSVFGATTAQSFSSREW